jgi:hypothetical protein
MATSKLGPAGSLQPLNTNKGKWTDGLGALEIGTLSALATDIDKAIDTTVKQVARGKIRVGKLLLEARAQFKEDAAFGKWRKDKTMIQSKQHAHYLMQVAERFGDAVKLIDGANYSVMQELVLADQKDIEWVESKIEAGEPPTVVEVREKVKETQAERLKGTNKKGTPITQTGPVLSPNASVNSIIPMTLTMRIKTVVDQKIKGPEGDLAILGMDPDPQTPCHPDLLDVIQDHWLSLTDNDDEKRAVIDSTNRVAQEFKNWHSS